MAPTSKSSNAKKHGAKKKSSKRTPPELTRTNLRKAIGELLQVAQFWENNLDGDLESDATSHHTLLLEDFIYRIDRHWQRTPLGAGGKTKLRLGDANAIALRDRIESLLSQYRILDTPDARACVEGGPLGFDIEEVLVPVLRDECGFHELHVETAAVTDFLNRFRNTDPNSTKGWIEVAGGVSDAADIFMSDVVKIGGRRLHDVRKAIAEQYPDASLAEAAELLEIDAHGATTSVPECYREYALSLLGCPDWQTTEVMDELGKYDVPSIKNKPLAFVPHVKNKKGKVVAWVSYNEEAGIYTARKLADGEILAAGQNKEEVISEMERLTGIKTLATLREHRVHKSMVLPEKG